jgi:hypothetical protein
LDVPNYTICGAGPYYFGSNLAGLFGGTNAMMFDFQNPMMGSCPGQLTYRGPLTETQLNNFTIPADEPFVEMVLASMGPPKNVGPYATYFFVQGQTVDSAYIDTDGTSTEQPGTLTNVGTTDSSIFTISPSSGVLQTATTPGTVFTVTAVSLGGQLAGAARIDGDTSLNGGAPFFGDFQGYIYLEY